MSPSKKNYDKDNDNYKNYKVNYIIDKDESDKKRVLDSVDTVKFFDDIEMEKIETELDGMVDDARMRKFKRHTVETTRLRLKHFIILKQSLIACFVVKIFNSFGILNMSFCLGQHTPSVRVTIL